MTRWWTEPQPAAFWARQGSAKVPTGRHPGSRHGVSRVIVTAGAKIGDFPKPADRTVPTVCGRDKSFEVDKFVRAAALAVRTAGVVGISQGYLVGVAAAPARMLCCGTMVCGRRHRTHRQVRSHLRRCWSMWAVSGWRHCRPIPNAPAGLPDGSCCGERTFSYRCWSLFLTLNVFRIGHAMQVINGRGEYLPQVVHAYTSR